MPDVLGMYQAINVDRRPAEVGLISVSDRINWTC